ncbi:glycyl-tRNA synthetase beta chain [Barrientosiimonas humi]|uniref:Multifunctional fusion protein n=1 Tax=Barrientosiimonas humi TaxID=999931 RepID=A0A542XEE7_9MICO|nr:glycine--tRNA ligase [Barrientosiimonas humi]TQL34202.1 glycyl-tRNA synthetase beta chain [Barrientosiimonas humi]CAG7574194.1 Glycine--tRNA ligase alpha subunit [Barrientosiimonas humi]
MLTVQDALIRLQKFWTDRGCMVVQPFNTEVGAGTMNPATVMRVLGPEPWRVAYVEPSVRPDDSRYGENPNRLQTHTQFQVILKPDPGNPQELYLESLEALGIDIRAHDVRFVEDNWQQPAIGAWGLGWEVWLDGMEVTQFTYFQQVGGQNLDPVSVELTYGIERIMMAQQGVSHFKDMQYAPGLTYGEVFGQSEYEMSRYYLDDADIGANQDLFEHYTTEAQRLIDARLPVPAWTYVLKSSHAFNVLDARGAVSTTERAKSFSLMRRLAREVGQLWVERREELDFPLLKADLGQIQVGSAVMPPRPEEPEAPEAASLPTDAQDFALEIGVEELPPHVVGQAIDQVRQALTDGLAATRLTHGAIEVVGTPRRIVATVAGLSAREPDAETLRKGPKVSAAYDGEGNPTKAGEGFARGQKVAVEDLERAEFDGVEHVAVRISEQGRDVLEVMSALVADVVGSLRADKNMRWSDPQLSYSRPIRWLVALWGETVVPAQVSGLRAGRTTYVRRTDATPLVRVDDAAGLRNTLETHGLVLDPAKRRELVVEQATELARGVGGTVDVEAEAALVDEITNLVEEPRGILGSFGPKYLELPEQILTTVMRKHQRYLPVRDESGALMPHFVTMTNGEVDEDLVRAGNESVLRARYEDAAFFFDSDLKVPLADLRSGISKLTFEDRIGSMADRADRIRDVATALAADVELDADERSTLARAGELAKFDLSSQMVVELSSLAGTMAREYASRAGEPAAVAEALWQMELPRSTGDALPDSTPGALLALADRFDLLAAMFAIGAKPTGSSDPFALRRAALGVVNILRAQPALASITVERGLTAAADRLKQQGVDVSDESVESATEFVVGRFGQALRDEGVPVGLVNAVQALADAPGTAEQALRDIQQLAGDPQLAPTVEAVQRITRIVPAETAPTYDRALLASDAEDALAVYVEELPDHARDGLPAWLPDAHRLVAPLTTFFDDVLVMDPDEQVRAARLGLLQTIVDRAPAGIDWKALDSAL